MFPFNLILSVEARGKEKQHSVISYRPSEDMFQLLSGRQTSLLFYMFINPLTNMRCWTVMLSFFLLLFWICHCIVRST